MATNNDKKIWDYFKSKGLNDYACAGILGNLYAESGLNPKNLQNTGNKKLDMTDDEYCIAVDNGTYTNFIRDSYGFGLAQWTFWSRKQNLLNHVKSTNKSIGNLEAQLEFLYKELSESYKSALSILETATSILQASNAILLKYEKPADQSEAVQNKRASYGQQYYDKYAGSDKVKESGGGSMKIKVKEIMEIFEKMYKEHWSYVWGSAKKRCVDCSGAFVYAYKQFDKKIYHGSNSIARNYVGTLQSIDKAKPGYAAFKWKKNGAPSKYTDNKGNFYHIGLVDNTGKYVLNAKSTSAGFSRDSISSWHYVAPLNSVDYTESSVNNTTANTDAICQAIVNTKSGALNLRKLPNGARIAKIPKGMVIDVLSNNQDWWQVRYNGNVGYVDKSYLFVLYKVQVTANTLRIRQGAGTNYSIVGSIKDKGVYTIIGEADGKGATKWGLLESKKGYISLDYCNKV